MSRFKFLGALALISAATAYSARAAAPALPPDVVTADTIVVFHVDAAHVNPDQLQSSATALLGPNANKADDVLKQFKARFDKAAAAGVTGVTLVADAKKAAPAAAGAPEADADKDKGSAVVYIELKPDADVKAVEAMMTEEMDDAKKAETLFDQSGNQLAMHKKGNPFPVKPDAARQALFADALGTISDASIQVAFVPDEGTRDELMKQVATAPKGVKDVAPLLAKSKWMTLSIMFGNAPGINLSANAAAEADAKALADSINASLADLKAQAANPGPDAGPLGMVGPLVGPLLDSLKPTQTGTQVTVAIKTETLKTVVGFAANFGLLGGGPGGRPPGAGPAPQ